MTVNDILIIVFIIVFIVSITFYILACLFIENEYKKKISFQSLNY